MWPWLRVACDRVVRAELLAIAILCLGNVLRSTRPCLVLGLTQALRTSRLCTMFLSIVIQSHCVEIWL